MHDPNDTSRVILLGHLLITIPAIAAIPLVLYFGVYMFVPCLLLYCMCAGLAISWQPTPCYPLGSDPLRAMCVDYSITPGTAHLHLMRKWDTGNR